VRLGVINTKVSMNIISRSEQVGGKGATLKASAESL